MSNPQLENGYTKIANELLEALCKIRISGEAMQMLNVIIRKTYGYNKKSDSIATSQFMELTGLSRLAIPKARRKLLEMNLITVSKKGYSQILTYSIQKSYTKWIPISKKVHSIPKGTQVYTKKDTNCIPKGSTQKKKDNIQKKVTATAVKETVSKTTTDAIILTYQHAQGFPKIPAAEYPRHVIAAKRLYLTAEKDPDAAHGAIKWLKRESERKGLEWRLETVSKEFAAYLKYQKREKEAYG